jgi:hypothetical protein
MATSGRRRRVKEEVKGSECDQSISYPCTKWNETDKN